MPSVKILLLTFAALVLILFQLLFFTHNLSSAEVTPPGFKSEKPSTQQLIVGGSVSSDLIHRDGYSVTGLTEDQKILAAQSYAHGLVTNPAEYSCLLQLWDKESGWRWDAENGSSQAYGIPQSLPGSKMAQAGSDWHDNWKTQVDWGIWYIKNASYKTPCNAWQHSVAVGWY